MACQICEDLNRQLAKVTSDQHEAEGAFAKAKNEDEQGLALLAVARARRETISFRHRLEVHQRKGCSGDLRAGTSAP